jgi:hypothetical protein
VEFSLCILVISPQLGRFPSNKIEAHTNGFCEHLFREFRGPDLRERVAIMSFQTPTHFQTERQRYYVIDYCASAARGVRWDFGTILPRRNER